ncbi:MAG: serine/threonine protein kinase [Chloroflexi bacterium]|nr:serine/threonine protein kinase [Chloroflexota bacterium]
MAGRPDRTLCAGRYVLGDVIGSGATSTVVRARRVPPGDLVAAKLLTPALTADSEATARFFDGCRRLAELDHPGILSLYDFGRDADVVFAILAFAEHGSLRDCHRMLTAHEAAALVQQLASALHYLHQRGLVHADVKPANVLLDGANRPLLGDFGIMRAADPGDQPLAPQRRRGTPSYMAPEQCLGQRVDARTDQYALAIVAFELLTGRRPIAGGSVAEVMERQVRAAPLRPRLANPALSAETEAVLVRALAKAPSERYPSVRAFAAALRESVKHSDPAVRRPPLATPEVDEPTLPMIS